MADSSDASTDRRADRRPPDPGRLTAVIVNFNAGGYLAAAVASLLAQDEPGLEIIVVDNGSRDRSLETLAASLPSAAPVRICRLESNRGFAAACNVGLEAAAGKDILLLNPDCRLFAGALAALRGALDEDPEAGMAGPLLVNPDGSAQRGARRDIPTPWTIFCEVLQLHRLMPRHPRFRSFNRHLEPLPEAPEGVQAISGACMLVRHRALSEVGQLDPDYFLHFEDLDWCLRFDRAKWGVLFVPDAAVEHTTGVCSARRPVRVAYAKHRSLIRFLRKHFASYYPSSFMALVSAVVMLRFVLMVPVVVLARRPPREPLAPPRVASPRRHHEEA